MRLFVATSSLVVGTVIAVGAFSGCTTEPSYCRDIAKARDALIKLNGKSIGRRSAEELAPAADSLWRSTIGVGQSKQPPTGVMRNDAAELERNLHQLKAATRQKANLSAAEEAAVVATANSHLRALNVTMLEIEPEKALECD